MTNPTPEPPLLFEDLQIGQRYRSGTTTITEPQLIAFAREFDPQAQHTDPLLATESVFGTLVASGWHTAAISMRLQLEAMLHRVPGGAMGGKVDHLVWHRPVLPNDTLEVEIEVLDLRPSRSRPDRGIATLRTTTTNQRAEPVMELTAAVFFPTRPDPTA